MGVLVHNERLQGVHPELVRLVTDAAARMPWDITVVEGLRTAAQQAADVASGASKTMKSRHLDGHAVDLAPIVGGTVSWAWTPFYALAQHMRDQAIADGILTVWGGVWDRSVQELATDDMQHESQLYVGRFLKANPGRRTAFLDGPHFELARSAFPS